VRSRNDQPSVRRLLRLAGLLSAAVLLTHCGGAAAQSPSVSSSSGSGGSSTSSGSTGSTVQADDGFGWVPFGPSSPEDPPPSPWYGVIEDGSCSDIAAAGADVEEGVLSRALAAVCDAAIRGDQSKWKVAQSAAAELAAGGSGSSPGGCLEAAARALLKRALAWHAAHPGERPVVRYPRPGDRTACPFRITKVTVVDDTPDHQPMTGPLAGPVTGGTLLAIDGDGFTQRLEVRIAGHRAQIVQFPSSGGLIVATPGVSHPLSGVIRVVNRAGQVRAAPTFHYVAATGATSGP